MRLKTLHTHALVAVALVIGVAVQAGDAPNTKGKGKNKPGAGAANEKEGIEFILDHEKDLDLSATQKKQLEDINAKIAKEREKLIQDPEMLELFKEQKEAKDSGDQEAVHAARKKIRQAMEKKGGLKFENVVAEVGRILTPPQLKKLAELRKDAGMDPNPVKTAREEKKEDTADANRSHPDVNKGAPSLYDNEK